MPGKNDCSQANRGVRRSKPEIPEEPRDLRAKLQIIHRNRMFRDCLKAALASELNVDAPEVSSFLAEEFDAIDEFGADVMLIDAGLVGKQAVTLIQCIRQRNARVKVLAVVSASEQEMLTECIMAGAHGCIFEESSLQDLRSGIQAVTSHGSFCSQDMLQVVFSQFAHFARESTLRRSLETDDLTSRELEILNLISAHLGNKQIAKRLSISLHTVKNHVHNILDKLNLTSRFEAVDYARRRQWISVPSPDPLEERGRSFPER